MFLFSISSNTPLSSLSDEMLCQPFFLKESFNCLGSKETFSSQRGRKHTSQCLLERLVLSVPALLYCLPA